VRAAWLWESGDVKAALATGYEALEAEGEGSPWHAIGVAVVGLAYGGLGEWEQARTWMHEYGRLGQEFGQHLTAVSGFGSAAAFDAERGEWETAQRLAQLSLELSGRHGIDEHWSSAGGHVALGLLHERRGALAAAATELARAAELSARGAGPVTTATALLHLARVQAAAGHLDVGRAQLAQARRLVSGAPDPGIVADRLAAAERALRPRPAPASGGDEPLSERELDVLRLLATQLSQREIGGELYVSLNTVKTHTKSIFRKLGVSGRPEAVARARELGLL
jgi:LuxR family maltose regulon positive regulatory protein